MGGGRSFTNLHSYVSSSSVRLVGRSSFLGRRRSLAPLDFRRVGTLSRVRTSGVRDSGREFVLRGTTPRGRGFCGCRLVIYFIRDVEAGRIETVICSSVARDILPRLSRLVRSSKSLGRALFSGVLRTTDGDRSLAVCGSLSLTGSSPLMGRSVTGVVATRGGLVRRRSGRSVTGRRGGGTRRVGSGSLSRELRGHTLCSAVTFRSRLRGVFRVSGPSRV